MDRGDFVKYLNSHGFFSTKRFNGDHEIFKSIDHTNNFVVPRGKKDISKGYLWGFKRMLRNTKLQERGDLMVIIEKVMSWDRGSGTDCFGISGSTNIDHVYPESLGGSSTKANLQKLSVDANLQKANLTKGKINSFWRFCVVKNKTGNGVITGTMFIRHSDWDANDWKEVVPAK